MSEITNHDGMMSVAVTPAVVSLLEHYRVYCDHQYNDGPRRWKIGERLYFDRSYRLRPYSGYLGGHNLWHCGEYSYAHSVLPLTFSCGRYCSIAGNVRMSGWQHPVEAVTTSLVACNPHPRFVREARRDQGIEALRLAPTPQRPTPTVGNDVWIGADVQLMAGVNIADGAIIGTGAVVTKHVEPYAIVGGNPARLIRWRFPEDIRAALREIKWWQYRLDSFADLDFADTSAFVREFSKRRCSLEQWTPVTPLFKDAIESI